VEFKFKSISQIYKVRIILSIYCELILFLVNAKLLTINLYLYKKNWMG